MQPGETMRTLEGFSEGRTETAKQRVAVYHNLSKYVTN